MRHLLLFLVIFMSTCAPLPNKRFYLLNYTPDVPTNRISQNPWPCNLRIREFTIEGAYARSQIVYRKSPYELEYYFYHNWAVKPSAMMTDLVRKHLLTTGLVNSVVLRYDEGKMPDYELSGTISAIEEYDSESAWFAHLAFSLRLTRLSDNALVYSREFDSRRTVAAREPEQVVVALSELADFSIRECADDLDQVFAKEYPGTVIP